MNSSRPFYEGRRGTPSKILSGDENTHDLNNNNITPIPVPFIKIETRRSLQRFSQFITTHNPTLEAIIKVATQPDVELLTPALVSIFRAFDSLDDLKSFVIKSLQFDNDTEIYSFLREGSLRISLLSKLVQTNGKIYIRKVIHPCLKKIVKAKLDCEIDLHKIDHPENLEKNIKNLTKVSKLLFRCIWKSSRKIPCYIKDLLIQMYQLFKPAGITPLLLVGTMLFLRLITPAVSNFKYIIDAKRTLVLIAKLMQLIVNKNYTFEKNNVLKPFEHFIASEVPKAEKFAKTLLDVNVPSGTRQKPKAKSRNYDKSTVDLYFWVKRSEESLEKYISSTYGEQSCSALIEQIGCVHASFGSDPNVADDWQTVWKRVRNHLNDRSRNSTELTANEYSSPDSSEVSYQDDESTSDSDMVLTEESSLSVRNSSPRSYSTTCSSPREQPAMILKCFHERKRRLKLINLEQVVSFTRLLELIQQKFEFRETVAFRLKYHTKPVTLGGLPEEHYVEDRATLERFFETQGTFENLSIVYALWIIEHS
eukprot:TRINITY_DN8012_c0_g1_i1.p1 TRINITY_DN8012_c0_g1~~TRINITY_DN8012_c0_g1_i1.p1  ORF type:complete len:536 (-),score=79.48 TRINITY_DN8012_c0_g1_i1:17-1624(-)